jgi:hypothetical protein
LGTSRGLLRSGRQKRPPSARNDNAKGLCSSRGRGQRRRTRKASIESAGRFDQNRTRSSQWIPVGKTCRIPIPNSSPQHIPTARHGKPNAPASDNRSSLPLASGRCPKSRRSTPASGIASNAMVTRWKRSGSRACLDSMSVGLFTGPSIPSPRAIRVCSALTVTHGWDGSAKARPLLTRHAVSPWPESAAPRSCGT